MCVQLLQVYCVVGQQDQKDSSKCPAGDLIENCCLSKRWVYLVVVVRNLSIKNEVKKLKRTWKSRAMEVCDTFDSWSFKKVSTRCRAVPVL
jgi:hypothetical protein